MWCHILKAFEVQTDMFFATVAQRCYNQISAAHNIPNTTGKSVHRLVSTQNGNIQPTCSAGLTCLLKLPPHSHLPPDSTMFNLCKLIARTRAQVRQVLNGREEDEQMTR